MTKTKAPRPKATIYRLVVSFLRSDTFGTFQILAENVKREPNLSPQLESLKCLVLEELMINQKHRGLTNYTIAWQTHRSNGLAHLDILLKYDHAISKSASSFNYLLPLCPQDLALLPNRKPKVNITPYALTRLNVAIIEYGTKEDPQPLNTFTAEQSSYHLTLSAIKKNPYGYLRDRMALDPYNFDLAEYSVDYNLDSLIPNWSATKNKLTDIRAALIAKIQLSKPGILHISRALVESRLSPEELAIFDAYPAFQTIVDHLNQIPTYGPLRPHKTSNLFISGPKDIGKTSLFTELAKHCGYYQLKIENKYLNRYSNNKYGFILWNQIKLTDFTHTWILQFLEGAHVSIPMRYNSCIKRDNPLVVMTSNLCLETHIRNRFKDNTFFISHGLENLGARITSVNVTVPMFFMQKLLVSRNSHS